MALFPARSKVVLRYFSLIFKGQPKWKEYFSLSCFCLQLPMPATLIHQTIWLAHTKIWPHQTADRKQRLEAAWLGKARKSMMKNAAAISRGTVKSTNWKMEKRLFFRMKPLWKRKNPTRQAANGLIRPNWWITRLTPPPSVHSKAKAGRVTDRKKKNYA